MLKRSMAVVMCALVAGCGTGVDDAGEMDGIRGGHDATLTQQQTLGLADELFDFDPTLDPSKTAEANAMAVATRATSRIPCAMVTLSGTTVTITAPAAGCAVANGVTFSGTLAVGITKSGSSLTVTMTFTNFMLSGSAVTGTMTLVTSDGSTFQVAYALTRSGKTVTGMLTAVGAPGQISTSGTMTSGTTTATLTGVVWKKADCYPSAGSISVTQGRVTTSYTFTATTPSTGTVSTGRGRMTQLPAYGSCPNADGGR
jgi:hypothetical protein